MKCECGAEIPDCEYVVVYHATGLGKTLQETHQHTHTHPPSKKNQPCKTTGWPEEFKKILQPDFNPKWWRDPVKKQFPNEYITWAKLLKLRKNPKFIEYAPSANKHYYDSEHAKSNYPLLVASLGEVTYYLVPDDVDNKKP